VIVQEKETALSTAGETILGRLLTLGQFGQDGGIYYRTPFTAAETAAVDRVAEWMREAGLAVRRDAVGNVIGRVEGRDRSARVVATGSHLDSVRDGGVFDGPLGVVAGIEAVRRLLADRGTPAGPVEVIAFTGEEGSRFPVGLLGSQMMAGLLGPAEAAALPDREGTRLGDAIRRAGLDPAGLAGVARDDLGALIELHIEQGPILERAGVQVGVVETIVGIHRFQAVVVGQADHAGTTPLDMRADALLGAAEVVLALPELVRPSSGVVTVGQLEVAPGSSNVVPGRVVFSVDLRHSNPGELGRLAAAVQAQAGAIVARRGLRLDWRPVALTQPVATDLALRTRIERAAGALGFSSRVMVSGAGHDSMAIAAKCPVAMIFTPCRGGFSHRPDEYADAPMIDPGYAVLERTLGELAWPEPGGGR
jgi:allantoate deiminase